MGALDCVKPGMRTESTEVFTVNLSSNSTLNESRKDLESQQLKSEAGARRHSIWWSIAVDFPLFALVLVLIGLVELNVIPSYKGGFYCRDQALDHAFTGDTVTMAAVCIGVLMLPIAMFWLTEWVFSEKDTALLRSKEASFQCLRLYRLYLYGFFFNLVIVEVMKTVLGAPRPTFNAICRPDVWYTCKDSEYVTTFKCTSDDFSWWYQNDASHSFPSGHTSLSVYCALFIAWYLQKRAFSWGNRTVFSVPFLQMCLLTFAAVASLTRITDHRHHWWDVLCGLGVGLVSVYYAVVVLCDNFSQFKKSESRYLLSEDSRPVNTMIFDGRRGDTTP